jgi:adenylate cyclase
MILSAETRGFTRMSEILEPAAVVACISEFFVLVSSAVERHAGAVPNVFNDTLVATFAGEGNAQEAVRAAQEIRQDFASLAEAWKGDYDLHVAVAMGLHCGDIVTGTGHGSRPGQGLVVGDSVSVAERLLHRARAGEFVLSQAIMEALATAQVTLDAEELPALKIPPREPIRLFGVLLDTRLDFT